MNVWIEKTCVNLKINYLTAWMCEYALFFAWIREFPDFPDFQIIPRLFSIFFSDFRKVGFAWISRKICVNREKTFMWMSEIWVRFGGQGSKPDEKFCPTKFSTLIHNFRGTNVNRFSRVFTLFAKPLKQKIFLHITHLLVFSCNDGLVILISSLSFRDRPVISKTFFILIP